MYINGIMRHYYRVCEHAVEQEGASGCKLESLSHVSLTENQILMEWLLEANVLQYM